jgi:hypothetical protein
MRSIRCRASVRSERWAAPDTSRGRVIAYASAKASTPDEQDRLCRMIRAMDEEYLGWLAEKQKTSPDK